MAVAVVILYSFFLCFIFGYSLVQFNLALSYRRAKKQAAKDTPEMGDREWPQVTIQLPVYNELYVVERLIRAVCEIEYTKDKLEIQVLDDGNDESVEVASRVIREMQEKGVNITHVRRADRVGYKAGALAYGLDSAKGEFVAIFDADFIPNPSFLKETIPHFYTHDRVGVVQTRWEHLNEDYSLLTRLQAFGLDAHFRVEQVGRNSNGHFINFNGTAGVWRKSCIEDAGGWQSDTITEDLDLSYRAQEKHWEFIYLEHIGSPSELPVEMNALKGQQFRWTKGAAECTRKNLPSFLRNSGLSLSTKIHGTFHLLNSFIFICVLGTALLSVPILYIKSEYPEFRTLFNLASIFLLSLVILTFFYWVSRPKDKRRNFFSFLGRFLVFLSMSMGLSLHNSIAVIEGYIGRKTPFVRTPKFAVSSKDGQWTKNKYRALRANPLTLVELLLAGYFAFGLYMAHYLDDFGLFPFHLMLTFGFIAVSFYSVRHSIS